MPKNSHNILLYIFWLFSIILNVIEFYMPKVRSHGKETFANWWVLLQLWKEKYPNIPYYVVSKIANFINRLLGIKILSLNNFIVFIPFTLALSIINSYLWSKIRIIDYEDISLPIGFFIFLSVIVFILINFFAGLSLLISRLFLKWIVNKFSIMKLIFIVILDLGCAYLLMLGSVLVTVVPWTMIFGILDDIADIRQPHENFNFPSLFGEAWIALFLIAFLPSLFHIMFEIIIFIVKFLERPIFLFLLYTIEALQRTEKWAVAICFNVITVIYTIFYNWEKITKLL